MILDLARQGLTVSAIARRTGRDRKTIRTYIARGLEPLAYKPREPTPSPLGPFEAFLRERVGRFPDLTGRRLWREVRDLGFAGGFEHDEGRRFPMEELGSARLRTDERQ